MSLYTEAHESRRFLLFFVCFHFNFMYYVSGIKNNLRKWKDSSCSVKERIKIIEIF